MNGCLCSKIMCIGVQFGIMAHQVLIYLEDKYSRDICISPYVIGFSVFTNFVIALDCVPTITSENVYYFPYTLSKRKQNVAKIILIYQKMYLVYQNHRINFY